MGTGYSTAITEVKLRVIIRNLLKTLRTYRSSRNIPSLRLLKNNNLKLSMLLSVMDTSDTFTLEINHYVCFMEGNRTTHILD